MALGDGGRVVVDDLQRKVSGNLVHVKLGDKVDQLAIDLACDSGWLVFIQEKQSLCPLQCYCSTVTFATAAFTNVQNVASPNAFIERSERCAVAVHGNTDCSLCGWKASEPTMLWSFLSPDTQSDVQAHTERPKTQQTYHGVTTMDNLVDYCVDTVVQAKLPFHLQSTVQ